jgi:hypothetical protein
MGASGLPPLVVTNHTRFGGRLSTQSGRSFRPMASGTVAPLPPSVDTVGI